MDALAIESHTGSVPPCRITYGDHFFQKKHTGILHPPLGRVDNCTSGSGWGRAQSCTAAHRVFRAGNLLPLSVRPITRVVRAIIIAPGRQKAAKKTAILIWLGARGPAGWLCTQRLGSRRALINARARSVCVRASRSMSAPARSRRQTTTRP
jgi:hypothetical protein